ncbi:MAG: type 2 isopentenyl-diphosphate Delta-isomerase [Bdellovibrio sp.]
MKESNTQFEQRKRDHIRIALDPRSQAEGQTGLNSVHLIHEALPDLALKEVDISTSFSFGAQTLSLSSPLFISSMTAGHEQGQRINEALAQLSDRRQILMGVGSQRRELEDAQASREWLRVRQMAPRARLLGNIGIAQLIQSPIDGVRRLIESTEAVALFVHLNPLQEALQPEGTTDFRQGLAAIENLVQLAGVPVIVKEVGCGFSVATLKRLQETGVFAIDISGKGGTHWGRIEGLRSEEDALLYKVAQTFGNWGFSTLESLQNARKAELKCEIWASGGVRNGLEVAKLCALGAQKVGVAKPFLEAALSGDKALEELVQKMEMELKIAMFCTGSRNLKELQTKRVIQ